MAQLYVNNGSERAITFPAVKVSGVWQPLRHSFMKSGGVWRQVPHFLRMPVMAVREGTFADSWGFSGSIPGSTLTPQTDVRGTNNIASLWYDDPSGTTYMVMTGSAGQFATMTQTNYFSTLGVVGGSSVTSAGAFFWNKFGGDAFIQWQWLTDVFGFQAASGGDLTMYMLHA